MSTWPAPLSAPFQRNKGKYDSGKRTHKHSHDHRGADEPAGRIYGAGRPDGVRYIDSTDAIHNDNTENHHDGRPFCRRHWIR
jgi:hypothetical protein